MMSRDRDILDVYWKAVKEDSANFDGWVNLLQAVEQLVTRATFIYHLYISAIKFY